MRSKLEKCNEQEKFNQLRYEQLQSALSTVLSYAEITKSKVESSSSHFPELGFHLIPTKQQRSPPREKKSIAKA